MVEEAGQTIGDRRKEVRPEGGQTSLETLEGRRLREGGLPEPRDPARPHAAWIDREYRKVPNSNPLWVEMNRYILGGFPSSNVYHHEIPFWATPAECTKRLVVNLQI